MNVVYQLGIPNDNADKCEPVLINALKYVIDIQCNASYTIALCSGLNATIIIIRYWSKSASTKVSIPQDIINLIIQYIMMNLVLSVGYSSNGGHGHGDSGFYDITTFTEIEALRHKHIQKIRVGADQSYFLDFDGVVWVCGENDEGQLGLGHYESPVRRISCIDYFIDNDIRIKEIVPGASFVIMIDGNNGVWAFGDNSYGQICDRLRNHIYEPKELIMFRDCIVEEIKSGGYHIYVKCKGDKHYLWGENEIITYGKIIVNARVVGFGSNENQRCPSGCGNTKLIVQL